MSKSFFAVDKLNVIGKECFPLVAFVFNNKNYLVYYTPSSDKKCEVYVSKVSSDNNLVDVLSSEIDKFTPIVRDMVVLPSTYKKDDDINNLIKDFLSKYDIEFLADIPEIGEQSFHNVSSLFEIELDYIEYVDYFYSSALPRLNLDEKEDSNVADEKIHEEKKEEEKIVEKASIVSDDSSKNNDEIVVVDSSIKEDVPNLNFSFVSDEVIADKDSKSNESKDSSEVGAPSIADSLANYNALNGVNNNVISDTPTTNANVLDQIDASNYFGNIPNNNGVSNSNYGLVNSQVNFNNGTNVENNFPFFETNSGIDATVNNSNVVNNSYQNYGFNMPYMMSNNTNNASYGVSNVTLNSNNPNFHPVQPNLVENKNAGFASSKYIIIGTLCLIVASVIVAISIIFVNNL